MTVRTAISSLLAPTISVGLAACGESTERQLAIEGARAACAAVLQQRFGPQSEGKAIVMERVPNNSADAEKFEFVWKPAQISELSARAYLAEETPPSGVRQVLRELQVDSFVCRGSLKERLIADLWTREITLRGQTNEIRLTKHAITF